ncbi:hypothetical protein D3C78_1597600 [compost metagenome]
MVFQILGGAKQDGGALGNRRIAPSGEGSLCLRYRLPRVGRVRNLETADDVAGIRGVDVGRRFAGGAGNPAAADAIQECLLREIVHGSASFGYARRAADGAAG